MCLHYTPRACALSWPRNNIQSTPERRPNWYMLQENKMYSEYNHKHRGFHILIALVFISLETSQIIQDQRENAIQNDRAEVIGTHYRPFLCICVRLHAQIDVVCVRTCSVRKYLKKNWRHILQSILQRITPLVIMHKHSE